MEKKATPSDHNNKKISVKKFSDVKVVTINTFLNWKGNFSEYGSNFTNKNNKSTQKYLPMIAKSVFERLDKKFALSYYIYLFPKLLCLWKYYKF